MNIALSDTILYVTGKQGIENTTQQDLQTMVADYPYFAPVQLAYTAKLKSENSFKLQTQIQKAGLFFNNFKWLQYQMMEVNEGGFAASQHYNGLQEKVSEALLEENKKSLIIEEPDETLAFEIFEKEENLAIEEGRANKEIEPFADEQTIEKEQIIISENLPKNYADFMPNISIPTVEEVKGIMNGIDEKYEPTIASNIGEDNSINESEIYTNDEEKQIETQNKNENKNQNNASINETIDQEIIATKIEVEQDKAIPSTQENNITGFETLASEDFILPTAQVNDIHAEIAALKANWYKRNELEEIIFEPEKTTEIIEPIVAENETKIVSQNKIQLEQLTEITPTENKLATHLAAIKNEFDKPTNTQENQVLSFETEPYYTIDYFASQGIKFDITKAPQDKLTAKMLKFTDWLKKMKTTKPEINITVDDPELDKAIQNIAATSNQSREVVTETMAEIFAKQGKTEKAIQLYIKLSFLIPEKSTYFANKLKELKGI